MKIITYDSCLTGNGLAKLEIVAEQEYADTSMDCPQQIVSMMNTIFKIGHKAEEHVYLIGLSGSGSIRGIFLLTKGTATCSYLGTREIIQKLLLCNATMFIILHNHPGGSLKPSTEDVSITKKIAEAAQIFDMRFCDHIIVSGENFFSFMENSLL